MTEAVAIFVGGMALGGVIGYLFALERFLRKEKPVIKLEVTNEVLRNINGQIVTMWLDARGLMWMPKGVEFKTKAKL